MEESTQGRTLRESAGRGENTPTSGASGASDGHGDAVEIARHVVETLLYLARRQLEAAQAEARAGDHPTSFVHYQDALDSIRAAGTSAHLGWHEVSNERFTRRRRERGHR